MATIPQSFIDQEDGIAEATLTQQTGCFDRWRRFLGDMEIEDDFLDGFNRQQKVYILSAFAGSCRRNKYGKTTKTILTGRTVKSTLTHVRSSFRSNLRPDPALDDDTQSSLYLSRQLRGYIDADPSTKQAKCLPVSVFKKLLEDTFTPLSEALGQLGCGAFFFGMRSCEYLSVTGTRKTKRLKIRNIRFFKNNIEIKDKRSPVLKYADTVSITFEFQKK